MKRISKIIALSLIIIFLLNCSKKDNEPKVERTITAKENNEHSETESSIVSLTDEQIKAVGITFGQIEMKELTATIKANGNLRVPNNNKANVTSMYGGVIKTLNVQVGDYVRKGQVIATISNPEFIQLQEDYLTVGSRITYAEQEYRRQRELYDNDAGAKKNLQNAEAELKSLRTRRASLQKQIQLMGISPGKVSNSSMRSGLVVTAPISGTISNLIAEIGSYVDVTSPVAEIVDNNSLHLDLQIFEKDLPRVKVGQVIHFTLTNNPTTEYDALVQSVGTAFENESKTIPVHCRVIGDKAGLIDGMNITGLVSLDNILTSAVPNEAITSAEGKDYIFVLSDKKNEENHSHEQEKEDQTDTELKKSKKTTNFERVEIVKGTSDLGYTAITPIKELPQGTRIVTKGAFFINAKMTNSGGHEH